MSSGATDARGAFEQASKKCKTIPAAWEKHLPHAHHDTSAKVRRLMAAPGPNIIRLAQFSFHSDGISMQYSICPKTATY